MSPNESSDESVLFTEETRLSRELGLRDTIAIVVGRIIGSGIFRTPAPIFALTGSVSLFFGAWILGGVITLLAAFCIMEMVAMMPRSGGPYAYLKAAYPPVWTFLRGWAMFFVAETGAIAAVAIVFSEYTGFLFQAAGAPLTDVMRVSMALALIWILTAVNCFGVPLSGRLQQVFSTVKVAALVLVIAAGLTASPRPEHFSMSFWPAALDGTLFLSFFAAMRYAFFAYSGWEGATYVAEEVKNPRKNLPLSLLSGILGVMVLYLAANTAYLMQLSPVDFPASKSVAADAMKHALGGIGAILVAVAVMANTFGNVATQIMVKARTWQAMARDGLFFRGAAVLHPRYNTPNRALILQGCWASVLLLFASASKQAYETVIDFFSFTGAFFNVMTLLAVVVLRRKYPDAPRPFRVPLYPLPIVAACLVYGILMVSALVTAPVQSLLGVALTATGLIYYRMQAKSAS